MAAAAVPLYAVALGVGAAAGALLAALSGFGNILGQLPFGAYADLNGSRPAIRGALILVHVGACHPSCGDVGADRGFTR